VNVELIRYCYAPEHTLGYLIAGRFRCYTIERPWIPDITHGSKPYESCVPDGRYKLEPHNGNEHSDTWALVNPELQVYHYHEGPGRSAILFHVANYVDDVVGCIGPGLKSGILDGKQAVLSSGAAMSRLRQTLESGRHNLVIRPTKGTQEAHGPS
jgi:hypothetical protein